MSNNKHVVVRMVATGITGDNMSNWVSTTNDPIGTSVLNTYLTGTVEGNNGEGNVDISNYNKVIFSSQEIKTLATPVTIDELNNQLNALDNEVPSKFIQRYFVVRDGKK